MKMLGLQEFLKCHTSVLIFYLNEHNRNSSVPTKSFCCLFSDVSIFPFHTNCQQIDISPPGFMLNKASLKTMRIVTAYGLRPGIRKLMLTLTQDCSGASPHGQKRWARTGRSYLFLPSLTESDRAIFVGRVCWQSICLGLLLCALLRAGERAVGKESRQETSSALV